jgi:hypothetical protein
MTRTDLGEVMERAFEECRGLRAAGQAEYAHRDENAFANFDRVAERMGLKREQALLVFLEKHMDGIHAYVKGHKSQRESVKGRINDAIVYLTILRGMVEEETVFDGVFGPSEVLTTTSNTVKVGVVPPYTGRYA